MGKKPQQDEPPPFDQALEQVEQIISRIESGEIGLERSITEYERGAALIRSCRETLRRAEQRLQDLTAQMQAETGPAEKAADSSPDEGDAPDDEEAPF